MKKILALFILSLVILLSGCVETDLYYTQEEVDAIVSESNTELIQLMLENFVRYDSDVLYENCEVIENYEKCDLILNVKDTETDLYRLLLQIQELEHRIEELEKE